MCQNTEAVKITMWQSVGPDYKRKVRGNIQDCSNAEKGNATNLRQFPFLYHK